MSVLKQDHFAYEEEEVIKTVLMGNKRLYEIMQRKEELYSKPDFNDEDGLELAELDVYKRQGLQSLLNFRLCLLLHNCIFYMHFLLDFLELFFI